jgi:hypothetical protein
VVLKGLLRRAVADAKTGGDERDNRKVLVFSYFAETVEWVRKHIERVKTGLPGVAYVRIDDTAAWPDFLTNGLVQ